MSGGLTLTRFPLGPLLRYLGRGTVVSFYRAAQLLGTSHAQVEQWAERGLIDTRADYIACKILGVHPMEIWGDLWLEAFPPIGPNERPWMVACSAGKRLATLAPYRRQAILKMSIEKGRARLGTSRSAYIKHKKQTCACYKGSDDTV